MSDTDIEWATKVWNFVRGCRRVSPGCGGAAGVGGCYAESQANRFKGPGQPYEGLVTLGKQGPRWTGVGRFVPEKLAEPMRWRAPRDGSRHRVFVNSMSDLFFEDFTNEQIAAGFGVMAACPQHDFLILTKRAERMRDWFRWAATLKPSTVLTCAHYAHLFAADEPTAKAQRDLHTAPYRMPAWPLPNVWLGVSAEDQQRAEERIPLLLETPAALRWVSAEPLLEPIDFRPFTAMLPAVQRGESYAVIGDRLGVHPARVGEAMRSIVARLDRSLQGSGLAAPDEPLLRDLGALSWIVTGGESGNGARPCDYRWIRSVVEQCEGARVPCFVKQLGAEPFETVYEAATNAFVAGRRELRSRKGSDPSEWPADLRVRQFPEASR